MQNYKKNPNPPKKVIHKYKLLPNNLAKWKELAIFAAKLWFIPS